MATIVKIVFSNWMASEKQLASARLSYKIELTEIHFFYKNTKPSFLFKVPVLYMYKKNIVSFQIIHEVVFRIHPNFTQNDNFECSSHII